MPQIEELKSQLSFFQRQLDFLRRLLGLITMKEKLELKIKAIQIAEEFKIDKRVFLAVIECESGFNPKAINKNPNGTTDYGICQFNDYWYWQKEKIISPDEALNNPEKALRVMAEMFVKGRASNWVCYLTGKYKKFLV